MFAFTKQEKAVLWMFLAITLSGSVLEFTFKKYPDLKSAARVMGSERMYSKVDLNKATVEDLVALPYIGQYTAENIVEYRRGHGPFTHLTQIKNVKGIKQKNYERFYKYLKI